jgi:hypothetical protein
MEVVIANDARDDLFAEISYQRIAWAEVIYDAQQGKFLLTLLGPPEGYAYPTFSLYEAIEALEKAKQRLMARGYGTHGEDG